ncbi:MAG: hypothetical protein H5U08_06890 [Thermogutta sp.]|uniref:hypothetical protein n=1 Tax=Thermogutta sp. TaxID=1962930 RepID=UPI0019B6EBC7|nr:hypothetical protein [Thermogutta sp.]MBC7352068.1 hypothetical protein [Thermogutta sp.]
MGHRETIRAYYLSGIGGQPSCNFEAPRRLEVTDPFGRLGILNPEDPIRVPYIPSPDWSRGLITDEAGQPGSWTDTHGWSKFFGATGVEFAAGAPAAKAAKARQAVTLVGSAQELEDANKLHHVFRSQHALMQQLVGRYGSKQAAYKVLQEAVVKTLEQQGKLAGEYEIEVVVSGMKVTVRGVIIDGVVRMGTAF